MKSTSKSSSKSGRANPLTDTLRSIPGMPTKLKIYKIENSRYWWCRLYFDGKYRFKSLKTESLKDAQKGARDFFNQILLESQTGQVKAPSARVSRSFIAVGSRFIESQNVPDKPRRYQDDKHKFNKELASYFGEKDVGEISSADVGALAKKLLTEGKAPATVGQYLIVTRKILRYASDNRLISAVPNFPKIKSNQGQTKRDYFPLDEYKRLVATIEEMAEEGALVRGVAVTLEFKYLVQFMVNSFIRPSDLRVLRRSHVKVQVNPTAKNKSDQNFLLLTHPATKTTAQEVVTMPAAYGIYKSLIEVQDNRIADLKARKSKIVKKLTDHVFFPEYPNRDTMIAVAGRIFSAAVKRAGLETESEKHTLYSLRHTSIMYRLLLGTTSTLELARNARTSQAMIDKFYASRLTPLMSVDSIHSFKEYPAPAKTATKKQ